MAVLKIYTFPDKVLAKKAAPIARVDKSLYKIADDMLETMYEAPGVGLAANQVGLLDRIIVVDADFEAEDIPEGEEPPSGVEVINNQIITNKKPRILLNPEIIYREGSKVYKEGCLSVPDYMAEVKRSARLKVQYQDIDGLSKTMDAEGLLAVVVQHEIDHLNGTLFIERLSPAKRDVIKRRLIQEREERENEE